MSQPTQPSPEQVYQQFNKNELESRQMFEMLYNSFIKLQQEYTKEKVEKAQLIEQLNQFTKQKDDSVSKNIKKEKK